VARRAPYTRVAKRGQLRPVHVRGQGDVLYRRFQCLAPECTHTLVVRDDECGPGFDVTCPECGFRHHHGGEVLVFDYDVVDRRTGETLDTGRFAPAHARYVELAERVKYCINCYTLQPLTAFDRHTARATGRQGECRMCKRLYNDLKNHTRLVEQHREAADNRRLLRELSGETRVGDIAVLLERFDHRCFNCERRLGSRPGGDDGYYLDHTLPVAWLWPLDVGPTVLCRACNGQKAEQWPSAFYGEPAKLRALATRTGIPYDVLAGEPRFNARAVERLKASSSEVIERWAAYPSRLRVLRERIIAAAGEDVFADATPEARRAIGLD
jgi:hypothetical protein